MTPQSTTATLAGAKRERIAAFDFLRILAAFAVIWLHVCSYYWYKAFPSVDWDILNAYNALVRWCVPIFVMITGALFLNPQGACSIRRLYLRYITRIVIAFVFWSLVYEPFQVSPATTLRGLVKHIITGPMHLWYLKMLVGLYVVMPLLRAIVARSRGTIYFLLLALATASLAPMLLTLLGHVDTGLQASFKHLFNSLEIKMALGFSGYLVLGHYLHTHPLSAKSRHIVYVLALMSLLCVIIGTHLYSHHIHHPKDYFYDYLNPFTLIESVAVFVFVQAHAKNASSRQRSIAANISRYTFGIYLVHLLIRNLLVQHFKLDTTGWGTLYFVPVFTIVIFSISLLIIWQVGKIPWFKTHVI